MKNSVDKVVFNPFVYDPVIPWHRKIQIGLASFTLAPIRLIFFLISFVLAWISALIGLAGLTEKDLAEAPVSGWRKKMKSLVTFFLKISILSCGVIWRFKGVPAHRTEAVGFICAPHSSFVETLLVALIDDIPSPVPHSGAASIPMMGSILKFAQSIFVVRESKDSKKKTADEMLRRASSNGLWNQFILFPEGTLTNGKALIVFKPGAFMPGKPVQPVCLRYHNEWNTTTYSWYGRGALTVFWMTLCKLWTNMEVEYLPVYYPNDQEQANPQLYADHVRQVMARALKLPTTEHTYDDGRLMMHAESLKLDVDEGLIEVNAIQKRFGFSFTAIKEMMDQYSVLSFLDGKRKPVSIATFGKFLGVPIDDAIENLFSLYNQNVSGYVNFKMYVNGTGRLLEELSVDGVTELSFRLLDPSEKQYLTKLEFISKVKEVLNMETSCAEEFYSKLDPSADGKITEDNFRRALRDVAQHMYLLVTLSKRRLVEESGYLVVRSQDTSSAILGMPHSSPFMPDNLLLSDGEFPN